MKTSLTSSLPLILMVAIAALGLGIWFSFDHHHEHSAAEKIDLSEFFTESYPLANGEVVVAQDLMSELNLINFWATWCAPCRHEMPTFEIFYQKYKDQGFSVLGLTIDDSEPSNIFLESVGVTYPAIILGDAGWELLVRFGNNKGLLPYSILTDKKGKVLERKLGEIDMDLLSKWIKNHLK